MSELESQLESQVESQIESEEAAQSAEVVDPEKLFIPQSVTCKNASFTASYTYHHPLPACLQENPLAPCILGVDEAGRGPVLGPMVYGVAFCTEEYADKISGHGFMDSKVLSAEVRSELLSQMCDSTHELYREISWSTRIMTPRDISTCMLRSKPSQIINLNAQAHDATINLIREVMERGVNVTQIFVDTVGPPETYQKKLQHLFPQATVTVSKKADSIYPIVSVASVAAKVTRDAALSTVPEGGEHIWGSGYPSDPRTVAWLKSSFDQVFGWNDVVRFSWGTAKTMMDKNCVDVEWPEPEETGNMNIMGMFGKKDEGFTTAWYGKAVTPMEF
ncbi:ribonuclease HII [Saitoella complicata NRRL Y-17804]|uniref:Ribonuclease n=1 Tax=Saitoella complicata (strain BCRC 22490 / CBS 7301 / JCM 7358 / NBRC 10748 / NRRL Y-17804) TaxID=698492 RepID=A0A0E9N958_SAICN|nr:ribonuclease HII [Saitoella complicata NRRL Y-17804]ODQ53281.1 ribonuclease HII [Saitoella complicata NRRL Y-17804]GAO46407.1 hypothetical protein G7K_0638-t1 [Saitoella complicata NRRL Y-17804]